MGEVLRQCQMMARGEPYRALDGCGVGVGQGCGDVSVRPDDDAAAGPGGVAVGDQPVGVDQGVGIGAAPGDHSQDPRRRQRGIESGGGFVSEQQDHEAGTELFA